MTAVLSEDLCNEISLLKNDERITVKLKKNKIKIKNKKMLCYFNVCTVRLYNLLYRTTSAQQILLWLTEIRLSVFNIMYHNGMNSAKTKTLPHFS